MKRTPETEDARKPTRPHSAWLEEGPITVRIRPASPPRVRVDSPPRSGAPLSDVPERSEAARPRLPCPSSSPVRPTSGPQEAPPTRDSAGSTLLSQPPGGRHLNPNEIRTTIADAVKCIVWAIVNHDHRMSADWLEDIASQVQGASIDDRRVAIRKAREGKVR